MPIRNLKQLSQFLETSRLVEPAQIEACRVLLGKNQTQPEDLVQILGSRGYLTSFQAAQLRAGETDGLVIGNYKLMYRNASGGYARVFRATSLADGSMIGIKVLRRRHAGDTTEVTRFRREAERGMKLKHKNIVPIYEVGSDGDFHFFTMEFVEGGNLKELLSIRSRVSPVEATRWVLDICEGLWYALQQGVTHRDLKMSNVLMSTRGVVKLIDFGLGGTASDTATYRTLEYGALEDATEAPPNDPRSDLFFLGAIFYQLLVGRPPFPPTESREERRRFSRYANVPALTSVDPNVPRTLVGVVERLMAIDLHRRYQRPGEVIPDLKRALTEIAAPEERAAPTRPAPSIPAPSIPAPASSAPLSVRVPSEGSALPTVLCINARMKQQDVLRKYLSERGFRVLMFGDLERGLMRLKANPPDCLVLMADTLGDAALDAYHDASGMTGRAPAVVMVLGKSQADAKRKLPVSEKSNVLLHPVTIGDLRREIQRLLTNSGFAFADGGRE